MSVASDMKEERVRALARLEAADVARAVVAELAPHIAQAVGQSTDAAMRRALSDPETWSQAIRAIQARAQSHAGGWLLGGIGSLVRKAMWIMIAGMGIYMLGGWTALASVAKAVFGSHEP